MLDRFAGKSGLNQSDHAESYTLILIRRLVDRYNVCVFATCTEWTEWSSGNAGFSNAVGKSYEKWHGSVNARVKLYGGGGGGGGDKLFSCWQRLDTDLIEKKEGQVAGARSEEVDCSLERVKYRVEDAGFVIERRCVS